MPSQMLCIARGSNLNEPNCMDYPHSVLHFESCTELDICYSQSAIPHPPREDCSGSLRHGSESTALRADLRRCELWAWIVSHWLFSVPWYDYTGPFAALRLHPIIDASPLYDDESHLMSLAPQKATTDAYIWRNGGQEAHILLWLIYAALLLEFVVVNNVMRVLMIGLILVFL